MLAFDNKLFDALARSISSRVATVGVIGLGYVGLPLATAIARTKFPTLGFDVDPKKIGLFNKGISYIDAVSSAGLQNLVAEERIRATAAFGILHIDK